MVTSYGASAAAPGAEGAHFPHVVIADPDMTDAPRWLENAAPALLERLRRAGAILLRGFPLRSASEFRDAVAAISPELRDYAGGTSPRRQITDGVYTSTEYPKHLEIPLHNEMSYSSRWPELLFFFCVTPAAGGGETPIADSRQVLARMPEAIVAEFERRQLMYVRNLAGADSRYNSWTRAFETCDSNRVEALCRELDIDFEWQRGGGLRTREVRPALLAHPITGERTWFNQVHLWHASNTPSASGVSAQIESALPMAAYFGDGGRLSSETLATVRRVLGSERRLFRWQRGDLLMLDNILTAHGRMPFEGERQVLVAMA